MARWTLFVNIKEFEFSNIKLWFEGRHVVKSQGAGCPLEGTETGKECESGFWGAGSLLSLVLFA